MRSRALRFCADVQLRWLIVAIAACIGALGVLGYIHMYVHDLPPYVHSRSLFDLDAEFNLPPVFSGLLLLAAAGFALLLYDVDRTARWSVFGLGVFFAYMAVDEATEIHERLDVLFGVNWQLLYAPLVLAGAVLWALVVRHLWSMRLARALLVGGAAAWFVAQAFEASPNRGLFGVWRILVEELLEMCGSAMFAIALLVAVRHKLATGHDSH